MQGSKGPYRKSGDVVSATEWNDIRKRVETIENVRSQTLKINRNGNGWTIDHRGDREDYPFRVRILREYESGTDYITFSVGEGRGEPEYPFFDTIYVYDTQIGELTTIEMTAVETVELDTSGSTTLDNGVIYYEVDTSGSPDTATLKVANTLPNPGDTGTQIVIVAYFKYDDASDKAFGLVQELRSNPIVARGTYVDDYTVKVSASDTVPDYLFEQIESATFVGDAGLALGKTIHAAYLPGETMSLDVQVQNSIAIDLGTNSLELVNDENAPTDGKFYGISGGAKGWFTPGALANDHKVKITAADTAESYLDAAIDEGEAILTTVVNPGADETLKIDVRYQRSLEVDTAGGNNDLQLVNDEDNPSSGGDWNVYGCDNTGARGWFEMGLVVVGPGDTPEDLSTKLLDGDGIAISVAGTSPDQIEIAVDYQMSLTADSSGIKLVNDETAPGNFQMYSTDGSGTRGWNDAHLSLVSSADTTPGDLSSKIEGGEGIATPAITSPGGNEGVEINLDYEMSITVDGVSDKVRLVGDSAAPGNNYFYGTEGAGTKGWNALTQVTMIVDEQLDASNNLQIKTRTGYVWNPGAVSAWTTVTGWTTTPCSS